MEQKTEIASVKNPARLFLLQVVREAGERFLKKNILLNRIQAGQVTKAQWRAFAIQRFLAASLFEALLHHGIKSATEHGYDHLAEVLKKNLQDEMGSDNDGAINPDRSHATWRKDFYRQLGIEEKHLTEAALTEGTKAYNNSLRQLIQSNDPLIIGGALLILEGTIPTEFRKLKEGRDKIFREEFSDDENDDMATRKMKIRARIYLEDHIQHDATSHFPELLKALEGYTTTTEQERIRLGAMKITEAKVVFYANPEGIL